MYLITKFQTKVYNENTTRNFWWGPSSWNTTEEHSSICSTRWSPILRREEQWDGRSLGPWCLHKGTLSFQLGLAHQRKINFHFYKATVDLWFLLYWLYLYLHNSRSASSKIMKETNCELCFLSLRPPQHALLLVSRTYILSPSSLLVGQSLVLPTSFTHNLSKFSYYVSFIQLQGPPSSQTTGTVMTL